MIVRLVAVHVAGTLGLLSFAVLLGGVNQLVKPGRPRHNKQVLSV